MKKNADRRSAALRPAGSQKSKALIQQLVVRNSSTRDGFPEWLCLPCVVFPR
jgi:hypothetical protein